MKRFFNFLFILGGLAYSSFTNGQFDPNWNCNYNDFCEMGFPSIVQRVNEVQFGGQTYIVAMGSSAPITASMSGCLAPSYVSPIIPAFAYTSNGLAFFDTDGVKHPEFSRALPVSAYGWAADLRSYSACVETSLGLMIGGRFNFRSTLNTNNNQDRNANGIAFMTANPIAIAMTGTSGQYINVKWPSDETVQQATSRIVTDLLPIPGTNQVVVAYHFEGIFPSQIKMGVLDLNPDNNGRLGWAVNPVVVDTYTTSNVSKCQLKFLKTENGTNYNVVFIASDYTSQSGCCIHKWDYTNNPTMVEPIGPINAGIRARDIEFGFKNRLLIAGNFNYTDPLGNKHVCLLELENDYTVNTGFKYSTSDYVNDIIETCDGYIIGGNFSSVCEYTGTTQQNIRPFRKLAALNLNEAVPGIGFLGTDYTNGNINSDVRDIYLEQDGDLILGGHWFVGDQSFNSKVRKYSNVQVCSDAFFDPRSLEVDNTNSTQIGVYPNPALNQINISNTDLFEGQTQVTIFDLQGRVVLTQQINMVKGSTYQIDLSSLTNGSYLIYLNNENATSRQKIVVQK